MSVKFLIIIGLLLSSCAPTPRPAANNTLAPILSPDQTETSLPDATLPPYPNSTALPELVPSSTPVAGQNLPPASAPTALTEFLAKLQVGSKPVAYIKNDCEVLSMRWNPQNSAPGTMVVPVMIHSIAKSTRKITDNTTISADYFTKFIEYAYKNGFKTITTAQLVDFLNHNAAIPPRSLLLIVDDRKTADFYNTYFVPINQKYQYTVTNAWIATPSSSEALWKENAQFAATGLVDFQAHGVVHNIPITSTSTPDYIHGEIFGPIEPMLEHFGKRPIAFIWPRGRFTSGAVQVARQAGYQVGFSSYPRGPILFNWIPLGADELAVGDPLMVLPRFWSPSMLSDLVRALKISQAAQDFYAKQKASDLAYYHQYCSGYPDIAGNPAP